MRTNALIYPLYISEPDKATVTFNSHGEPAVVSIPDNAGDFGDGVECWVQTNTDDAKGVYEDGEFRRCAYTVLIDSESFGANIVKVVRSDENLGTFRVMQRENLSSMGRIRLMLRQ